MSLTVKAYTLTNKENSTLQPTGAGTQFSCVLKSECGVVNPSIELQTSSNPTVYNYFYITSFKRYYKVSEWKYNRGIWTAELTCDVLATYKSEIGGSTLYVLRAADTYNGQIVDNKYPTKSNCQYQSTTITRPWVSAGTGCYILGIVSQNPEFGSVNYYAMSASDLATLINALLDTTLLSNNGFDVNDCSLALQKSLIDPLQYIKSAMYIPLAYSSISGTTVSQIDVFGWIISCGGKQISSASPYIYSVSPITAAIIDHPDKASRGEYLNVAPYTQATLSFPPFGVIELDTTAICNAGNLNITWYVDLPSGRGILEVAANGKVQNVIEAQVGVPIQISQVTRDYLGAAQSAVNGVTGAIGNALTGNVAGAIGSGVSAIGDVTRALIPKSQTIGGGGSYAQLFTPCKIDFQFFRPVDDDLTHNGRPLCELKTLSSLSGYQLIQDGDVAISGTAEEAAQIKNYLETGYYYE